MLKQFKVGTLEYEISTLLSKCMQPKEIVKQNAHQHTTINSITQHANTQFARQNLIHNTQNNHSIARMAQNNMNTKQWDASINEKEVATIPFEGIQAKPRTRYKWIVKQAYKYDVPLKSPIDEWIIARQRVLEDLNRSHGEQGITSNGEDEVILDRPWIHKPSLYRKLPLAPEFFYTLNQFERTIQVGLKIHIAHVHPSLILFACSILLMIRSYCCSQQYTVASHICFLIHSQTLRGHRNILIIAWHSLEQHWSSK